MLRKCQLFGFPPAGVANGKWPIKRRYPTQAKGRLEWGTQHLLPVWRKPWRLFYHFRDCWVPQFKPCFWA
jgi:hypothetical protein